MALQDLTPQLRTRLSRVERAAGLFVALAILLMLSGFGYYAYTTALKKGWFDLKVRYFTYLESGAGLKVGDTVRLMGFPAGQITRIIGEDPAKPYNVYVEFEIRSPHYGYIWAPDSKVNATALDFLGNRYLEVTKGGLSGATNLHATYVEKEIDGKKAITDFWNEKEQRYVPLTADSPPYFLPPVESPAVTDRLQRFADMIQQALPSILNLTNSLVTTLENTSNTASNANHLLTSLQPLATNLVHITDMLTEGRGSFGDWLLPVALQQRLDTLLTTANASVSNADTNLTLVASNLTVALEHLADLTANFAAQARANTNLLNEISQSVIHTDELVQGLKNHWLLRSSFREERNSLTPRPPPVRGNQHERQP